MIDSPIDIFVLFNEQENEVEKIVATLDNSGLRTYFWRRDIPFGEEWEQTENNYLQKAGIVLVFLGERGWGPNHLRLAQEAQKLKKRIVPVLIGNASDASLKEVDSLFIRLRYVDLRLKGKDSMKVLLDSLHTGLPQLNTSRFDQLINTLVDGNEEQRANLVEQIHTMSHDDRAAISGRLRSEVRESFNPNNEKNFSTAVRDPKKISSVRSWMLSAIIWADAEDELNRELLMAHLNPRSEPDENVRYWTLAGLYQKSVSYLNDAVELSVSSKPGVVQLLALAVKLNSDPDEIDRFRKSLFSEKFEESWKILRILRIVPIPELAPDVCKLLRESTGNAPIIYDSFYALVHPVMAGAAVSILKTDPGVRSIVDRMIRTVIGSNLNAVKNFTKMLLPFDSEGVDAAIDEARGIAETRYVANQIRIYLARFRGRNIEPNVSIAGYASDGINVKEDQLNIQRDVQTLTAIMLAKEVTPPLAIGLFGDWGSGKSFFMQSIRSEVDRIKKISAARSESPFCTHIVQIEFNAWHYADTNLWASLVSSIFEKLAAHVSPKQTTEEQQAAFFSELGSTKLIIKEAEIEKENVQKLIDDKQKELQELQLQRLQKQSSLKDLQLSDISKILSGSEKKELNDSLTELGIPPTLNTISDFETVASDIYTVKGRITGMFFSLLSSKNFISVMVLLVFILIGIPVGSWVIHKYLNTSEFVTKISAIAAELLAGFSIFFVGLRKALAKVKSGVAVIEATRGRIESTLADKRKNPTADEKSLQEDISKLSTKEKEAISRLSLATTNLIQIEERIKCLKEEKSLNRFLIERIGSDDYRKHMGLISTIRQDFESLAVRLAASSSAESGPHLKPVDRIILYIDDLDRCAAEKVMEVLQAVHLLLAYPLFIVVVGVDPRWLLHSLGSTFSAFENSGKRFSSNPSQWRSTPQNFLEKIFQIPFSLRPMSSTGYENLIHNLLKPAEEPHAIFQTNLSSRVEQEVKIDQSLMRTSNDQIESINKVNDDTNKADKQETNLTANANVKSESENSDLFLISDESLIIKPWETQFAENLFKLIPTPRAAKRFSNVYRILKASVLRVDLDKFEGSQQLPGSFQVPMLLLAILIGAPAEASKLFPHLLNHLASGGNIKDGLLKRMETEEDYSSLKEQLFPIFDGDWFPSDPKIFSEWIPRVSRFSFELSKIN